MRRVILLLLIFALGVVMLYLSDFWFLDLWPRSGLFGIEALRPEGGLISRWLRGTPLAPFALLIWAVAVFLILTYLQRLIDYLSTPADLNKETGHD